MYVDVTDAIRVNNDALLLLTPYLPIEIYQKHGLLEHVYRTDNLFALKHLLDCQPREVMHLITQPINTVIEHNSVNVFFLISIEQSVPDIWTTMVMFIVRYKNYNLARCMLDYNIVPKEIEDL